jgi:hypothetical protein
LISETSFAFAKDFNTSSETQTTLFSFNSFFNLFAISHSETPSFFAASIISDILSEYFSIFKIWLCEIHEPSKTSLGSLLSNSHRALSNSILSSHILSNQSLNLFKCLSIVFT